jgi:hypothetical protein
MHSHDGLGGRRRAAVGIVHRGQESRQERPQLGHQPTLRVPPFGSSHRQATDWLRSDLPLLGSDRDRGRDHRGMVLLNPCAHHHHQRIGEFGYYGIMSPYQNGWAGLTPAQVQQVVAYIAARRGALNQVGLLLGGGRQDPIHSTATSELAILERSGIKVVPTFINGGHEWYVWRILLRDFLTRATRRSTRRLPAG